MQSLRRFSHTKNSILFKFMQIYNWKNSIVSIHVGLERHPAAVDDYAGGDGGNTGDTT
jgi:hypothetical protein